MAKKKKSTRVLEEQRRLAELYTNLPEDVKILVLKLLERAAFVSVEMEELEPFIAENGWTEMFSQGKQEPYERSRPKGQTYISLFTSYQKVISQLYGYLPKDAPKPSDAGDGFDDFVYGRDDQ